MDARSGRGFAPGVPDVRPVAGDLIRHLAERHGDRVLAVLGENRLTYAEADRQSSALAKGLLASGVGKGARLGLLAPNGPDWIVTWLAGGRVGAVVIPLNTYATPRELDWQLRHSDTAVLVTVGSHLGQNCPDRLEQAVEGLRDQPRERIRALSHPYLRAAWVLGEGEQPARPWAGALADLAARGAEIDDDLLLAVEAQVSPADPMVVVYSSGSTADPKGAIHTHGAVLRHGLNLTQFRELRAGDRVYTPMPFFWVGGLSFALVRAMHAGATLVLEERFEPGATLELLEREQVTHVLGWPHMGPALTGHPDYARRDLSSIRGGGVLELLPADVRPSDPGLVAGSLGMTETLGPHLIDHEGSELTETRRGSFGCTVPGLEHRVVAPDGRVCRPGEPGELWVRGYAVMAGLHKREREDVFTPDGWYRTGDGGWFDDDGHFFFTGRLGELIKSAGMNVSPREVEQALEDQPEVTRAVVVGIPAGDRGQDVAAAIVVPALAGGPGAGGADAGGAAGEVAAGELAGRVRGTLSAYKVPRHMAVFTDDGQLPWLDSGKVDRRAVAAMLAARFGGR